MHRNAKRRKLGASNSDNAVTQMTHWGEKNSEKSIIDSVATTAQMAEVAKVIPEEWRPAAVGDAATCARRWVDQFEAGADGLIIHASTPEEFEPVLREYERIRPNHLFEGRTNRPGG